nr:hypothetical protein [Pandoravirus belohorizontensis]
MDKASRKRPVAHTPDEFRTLVCGLAARPSKRHRRAGRRILHAYATPCDDTDVFDTLPLEMVREVLMRVDCWRDVVAFQASARRFANVLAPCDTWTRKYAPDTPHDLTVSVRARVNVVGLERATDDDNANPCDEPIEAFVAVYDRWGMAAKGFDVAGLCRLAAAGRTDALLWLDARVCQMHSDSPETTPDDGAGGTLGKPAVFRCRVKYAREAAAAGQSATLAAVLAAHPGLADEGEKIMRSAIESDCAATVDVVHDFARRAGAWPCYVHRWCRDVFVPVPPTSPLASSGSPLSVLTYLKAAGCPAAPKPTPFAMGMAISAGLLRVAAWLDALPEVQARPHQLGRCSRRDIDRAAANGHYGVVRWVHERGIRRCALSTLLAGIRSGHHQGRADFVRWALAEEDPLWSRGKDPAEPDRRGADHANAAPATDAWTSRPPAARERPPPARVPEWRDGLLAIEAAKVGALDVVRWLYETHPEMVTLEAARAAASTCNADVAIYLHEVGVAPLAAYPCLRRASEQVPQGERRSRQSVDRVAEALDKLAAAGAPYDAQVLANVVRHQCAPALRIIVERYCVGSAGAADPVSRRGSSLPPPSLLPSSSAWPVRERRPPPSPWPTPADIMRAAVEADRLDMIRWVRDNVKGARLCVGVAAMRAAGRKANRIAALGRCRCAECKPCAATKGSA